MNKNNYDLLMNWLKKRNIKSIPYDLFIQYEIQELNYNKIFENLEISLNFSLKQVDSFIKHNDNVMEKYKKNIIFQYIYLILSPFIFENTNMLINTFTTTHKYILENKYNQLEIFLDTLPKNKSEYSDLNNIIRKVNKFINDYDYISYIEKILNSKENLGNINHSNIFKTQSIITDTLKMLFVHKCNVDLTDFLLNIKKISINEYSINLLKQKCQNSKIHFFEYMLNYYNNRFFYHGTNSKWLNEIKKYGLNGIHSFSYQKSITKAINLFETYGIYKIFEGKHTIEYLNYYVTDSIGSAVYYAHQSPEYLSRFCSNGDCMELLENCNHESFWNRDYNACLNNVLKLCQSVNMSETDTSFIVDLFKKLWKREVKKNQRPIIYVGKMLDIEQIDDNFNKIKNNINNYTFNQIYKIFTSPTNIHNKRFATIDKDFYSVIELPNLYKMYQLKQSDFPKQKYIVNNNKKYYPDIIIKNEYHKNVYFILDNSNEIQKISNTIYLIPSKFEYVSGYLEDSYYIQEIKYLLLTNGIGLTNKGKNYLLNNTIPFDSTYKYYLNLTNNLLSAYYNKNGENKISLYSIIANNVFYNLYIMNKTEKLPILVDCGYKSVLHYDYDINNYWYRSNAENNTTIYELDLIIKTIKKILNQLIK